VASEKRSLVSNPFPDEWWDEEEEPDDDDEEEWEDDDDCGCDEDEEVR
jgi:hypothetical protein